MGAQRTLTRIVFLPFSFIQANHFKTIERACVCMLERGGKKGVEAVESTKRRPAWSSSSLCISIPQLSSLLGPQRDVTLPLLALKARETLGSGEDESVGDELPLVTPSGETRCALTVCGPVVQNRTSRLSRPSHVQFGHTSLFLKKWAVGYLLLVNRLG